MRQLLICDGFGSEANPLRLIQNGTEHDFPTIGSGIETHVRGELSLILKRPNNDVGDIAVPVYAKDFSWSKKSSIPGDNKEVTITISPVDKPATDKHYTVVLVVKGKQFNERNKYSVTYTQKKGTDADVTDIHQYIADKFTKFNLPINTEGNEQWVDIASTQNDFDFELLGADDAFGAITDIRTAYETARNTPEELQELISKAAADKGFNYTYKAASEYLYPALNGVPAKESRKYTLYTLRFAEPRMVKTRDEVVHQIVQVVSFGTSSSSRGQAEFESWLKAMSSPTVIPNSANPDKEGAGDSALTE